MLWKVGLRMKPFLFLGRTVFAGTVENMHRHWKYRELVKIISKDRSMELVESATRTIEAESGGILVAVERVNKGHAIIMYRGKNYSRPADLRPKTLSSKKEAMKHSLEAQRCASLKLHVLSLYRNIDRLRHQMAKESSAVDTMQLTESDKSDVEGEKNEPSWSIGRDSGSAESSYQQENTEDNWILLKQVDEFSRNEDVGLASESTNSTNMSDIHADFISNEPEFLRESCQQEQVSESANNSLSKKYSDEEEAELSFGEEQSEQDLLILKILSELLLSRTVKGLYYENKL